MEITIELLKQTKKYVKVNGWEKLLLETGNDKDLNNTIKYIKYMSYNNKEIKIGYNPTKIKKKISKDKKVKKKNLIFYGLERFFLFIFSCFVTYVIFLFLKGCQEYLTLVKR